MKKNSLRNKLRKKFTEVAPDLPPEILDKLVDAACMTKTKGTKSDNLYASYTIDMNAATVRPDWQYVRKGNGFVVNMRADGT